MLQFMELQEVRHVLATEQQPFPSCITFRLMTSPLWALVSSSVKWGLGTEGYEVLSVTHPLTPALSRCSVQVLPGSDERQSPEVSVLREGPAW